MKCEKCGTWPTVRRIKTTIPGTAAVDLALCDCDYVPCSKCKRTTRGLPAGAKHCQHCGARV